MAGIGFVLRRLYRQDNLSGLVGACFHSAFAATGPWLFTVLALGTIALLGKDTMDIRVLLDFRAILIYNFSFSLVLSGPILMIATRYLADCIYRRDLTLAPGMFLGTLLVLWIAGGLIAGIFYFAYTTFSPAIALSAFINFLLVSTVWLASVFISAFKNYRLISYAFLLGMAIAVGACTILSHPYGVAGMINGFSLGLCIILALLLANLLTEYPYPFLRPFAFLGYFRTYWEIALSGLVYNMAIWVDKWIMWFAPEATRMPSGLLTYPYYDSAMFIAYMTTIPAMSMFLFNIETHFFEHYLRFYRDIERKASLARIEKDHQGITRSIYGSAGYVLLLQCCIAFLCILMGPQLIRFLHGDYMQLGILRFGLVGALFNVLTLFLMILLSYFDSRRLNLGIQLLFLLTNAGFTWCSIKAGFAYYGYGYFLSSFITFAAAAVIARKYVARLPYHAFITTNASIA